MFEQEELEHHVQVKLPDGGHDNISIQYHDDYYDYKINIPGGDYAPGMIALVGSEGIRYGNKDGNNVITRKWEVFAKNKKKSAQNEAKSKQIKPNSPETIII